MFYCVLILGKVFRDRGFPEVLLQLGSGVYCGFLLFFAPLGYILSIHHWPRCSEVCYQ